MTDDGQSSGPPGSLTVVGTGFMGAGQITPEALAHIDRADRFFYLGGDAATRMWLEGRNPTSKSLYSEYEVGGPRRDAYKRMAARMVEPVREGLDVCVAFYGHPGVFVDPSHRAIRAARAEGYQARMLPGVSAEDCLFADCLIDPVASGCHSYEATHFLNRKPRFDPDGSLVLWQIGGVGVRTYEREALWSASGLRELIDHLRGFYPDDHEVVVYEAAMFAVCEPSIIRVPLGRVPEVPVTTSSTMYVPPIGTAVDSLDVGSPAGSRASLTVVGTGYNVAGQVTPEAQAHLKMADQAFYLLSDPFTSAWVRDLNSETTSLHDSYWEGRSGVEACGEMVERVLAPLEEGQRVVAAFYGHPAIFVPPGRESVRRARASGHRAEMLPAISAPDCLYADLGIDPGRLGCQLYESTDFMESERPVEIGTPIVLLQAGAVGVREYTEDIAGDREAFGRLASRLADFHSPDHEVVLYEMSQNPMHEPRIERFPLREAADREFTVYATLYVPSDQGADAERPPD
ncbi:MAG: SAM-dependent methyltransferase [Gemmatimonadota bacterium]|nr:SAM-dependent methyltransferase [Gemmatimonadota bacterium]